MLGREVGHVRRVVGEPGEVVPGQLIGPEARLAELGHGGAPLCRIQVREVPGRPRPAAARRRQADRHAARSPRPRRTHLRSYAATGIPAASQLTDQSPRICPTTCGKSVDFGMCRRCAEGPVRAPGYPPRLAGPSRAAHPAGPRCCWTTSARTAAGAWSSSTTARRRRRICTTSPAPSPPPGSPITVQPRRPSTSHGSARARRRRCLPRTPSTRKAGHRSPHRR